MKETIEIPVKSYEALQDLYRRFYQIHSQLERRPCQDGKKTAATLVEAHFSGAQAKALIQTAKQEFGL